MIRWCVVSSLVDAWSGGGRDKGDHGVTSSREEKATGSCLSDPAGPSMEKGALGVPRTHMFFSGEAWSKDRGLPYINWAAKPINSIKITVLINGN